MYPHHLRTIERLTEHFEHDPSVRALIIGGSVAKGWAAENSDVDFMLVVSEENYAQRASTGDYFFFSRDFTDYPDGYVDGKVITLDFLREVADHGSEPARAAFMRAFLAFTHVPELDDLLKRIPVYPEAERVDKIKRFYSEVLLMNWYVGEAEKRGDRYLLLTMASDLALFGGRLILAHNRVLYPYHKWFTRVLEGVEDKPQGYMKLMQALLDQPGAETAQAFTDAISAYHDWGVPFHEAVVQFMVDREWNWRAGRTPLHDW